MTDTRTIDMHMHSTASDGTLTPAALMEAAAKAGLSAAALTDHDTMDGIPQAAEAAKRLAFELVPGVELTSEYEGREVHVLGYYLSGSSPELNARLEEFRSFRSTRNERMIKRLQEEGFSITIRQLKEQFPDSVITRAHIARFLLETGQIPDIKTAFAEYIGENCRCYIERPKISPQEAVRLIVNAGGLAVLAHPVLYSMPDTMLRQMISQMKEAGLCGVEAVYSENTKADEQNMRRLADDFHLLVSGGSDFHGSSKPDIHLGTGKGNLHIPYAFLQSFKNMRKKNENSG